MPILKHVGRKKLLDEKECYKRWLELGTLEKVGQSFANEGKISPWTGKAFTDGAIRLAAYRYMREHPEETYNDLRASGGFIWTLEEWEQYLVKITMSSGWGRQAFLDWIERHGFEKYEKIYSARFSTASRLPGHGSKHISMES